MEPITPSAADGAEGGAGASGPVPPAVMLAGAGVGVLAALCVMIAVAWSRYSPDIRALYARGAPPAEEPYSPGSAALLDGLRNRPTQQFH